MDRIEIDGAAGGGQLLLTALALSLCTGTAFAMRGIRAQRSRPGLMRQHLTAVAAATRIGNARVHGAEPGAMALSFEPGEVSAGAYAFAIGTAGSATLVLQTVLPALWRCAAASSLTLEGGTHNPMAPSVDFLVDTFLPMLARMGVCAQLHLDRHGFYPAGGGKVRATVEPCASATPCVVDDDAGEATITATALISALTPEIGMRELKVVARHFALGEDATTLVSIPNAVGPGNALMIRVQRAGHVEIFTGFGERGVSAEQVAHRLVSEVDVYLASGAMVGEHLADQLLMPMALAGSGAFTTTAPSEHLISNAALIEKFLPVEIAREQLDAHKWRVSVTS